MGRALTGKVWVLPIEPLEERYSAQWLRWWPVELSRQGYDFVLVNPPQLTTTVERGQFLDAYGTHAYKAAQTQQMAAHFNAGDVHDDDIILLHDAWSPTVTALAYMRALGHVRCKLVGLLHAGTWDEWDLLSQEGLGVWAADVERGWMKALDAVCVATEFHKSLLVTKRGADASRVHVTGFPLHPDFVAEHCVPWDSREPVVVFPHRLAREKAPERFDALARRARGQGMSWLRTKDVCGTKGQYYRLLGQARVAVSFAQQETWGIAMLEAAMLGCHVVVPRRLSYPETFADTGALFFDDGCSEDSILAQVVKGLEQSKPFAYPADRWANAIEKIMEVACHRCHCTSQM